MPNDLRDQSNDIFVEDITVGGIFERDISSDKSISHPLEDK